MRLENAGRVSDLNGGRDLSVEARLGSRKPWAIADSASDIVEKGAGARAERAESLNTDRAKVDTVGNWRVFVIKQVTTPNF